MPSRLITALLCALALSIGTQLTASAASDFSSLRSAVLHNGDMPHGFNVSNYHLFPNYSSKMTVAGKSCTASQASKGAWKQGLHQVFLKGFAASTSVDDLETCAYLYTNSDVAASDYRVIFAAAQKSFKAHTTVHMQAPRIGDASFLAVAPQLNGSPGAYLLAFRYRNALFGLSYVYQGKAQLSATAFTHLGQLIAGRLGKSK